MKKIECEACLNDARYINVRGEMLCGVCDMLAGRPSIRLSDVPKLIDALNQIIADPASSRSLEDKIKEMLWRNTTS